MNAPSPIRAASTGTERLARFEAWQRRQTSERRDQMAALIVNRMDADMRLRVIRAAVADLSGYAGGHDTIIDGIDLIQADLDHENSFTGLVPVTARGA